MYSTRTSSEVSACTKRVSWVAHCCRQIDTVTCREQFCLLNDIPTHTVIVTWNSNLEVICREDAEPFADGTFKTCVNLYDKLYIIHACINGHHMPVVFWLLTGKTEQHYNASVACNTWSLWQSRFPSPPAFRKFWLAHSRLRLLSYAWLTLSSFFYICAFVFVILLSNFCDFGLLHMYDFFVNLDFLLVILDIFRVMYET